MISCTILYVLPTTLVRWQIVFIRKLKCKNNNNNASNSNENNNNNSNKNFMCTTCDIIDYAWAHCLHSIYMICTRLHTKHSENNIYRNLYEWFWYCFCLFFCYGNSVCQHYYDKIVSIEVDKIRKCVCSMCHLNSVVFLLRLCFQGVKNRMYILFSLVEKRYKMNETDKLEFESNGNRSSKQNEISAIKSKISNKCVQTYYNVKKHKIAHPSGKALTNFHVLVSGRIFSSLHFLLLGIVDSNRWCCCCCCCHHSSSSSSSLLLLLWVVMPYQFSFHSGPMQIFILAKNTHMYAHTNKNMHTHPHTHPHPHTEITRII